MKVIDLLNKIANGEEVPKKIKYKDKEWEYLSTVRGTGYQYYSNAYQEWKTLQHQVYLEEHLIDEVEIIEEDKKIEHLDIYNCFKIMGIDTSGRLDDNFQNISDKINEIIDKMEK